MASRLTLPHTIALLITLLSFAACDDEDARTKDAAVADAHLADVPVADASPADVPREATDAPAPAASDGAQTPDSRSDSGPVGDAAAADLCTATGGSPATASCCLSAPDYPDLCAIGACGCALANSRATVVCSCPDGLCFSRERGCVGATCTPGVDSTCNDDPAISSLHGRCLPGGTCACNGGFDRNPATGRCR